MNPILLTIPGNAWTKVATNVTTGLITIKEWQPDRYYQTYRVTGDPAPTGDQGEDTSTITNGQEISIAATAPAIDVYLYCMEKSGGKVVVSL